jgi:hypothetical protein
MSKIVIDVDENFHKAVRIAAIEQDKTMKDFIVECVMNAIKTKNEFDKENIETKKVKNE